MAISEPPDLTTQAVNDARAGSIWSLIDERVHSLVSQALAALGLVRYRVSAINVSLVGTNVTPVAGYVASIGVEFNCRIVGYTIYANIEGDLTIDIWRSRPPLEGELPSEGPPPTHPFSENLTPFLISMVGSYARSSDMSLWTDDELLEGDILHFYIVSDENFAATAQEAGLVLRIQDLDARVGGVV